MSSYIPDDFRKEVKEQLDEIELTKYVLSDDELKKYLPKFYEFEKQERIAMEKLVKDKKYDTITEAYKFEGQIYNDYDRDFLFITSPVKATDKKIITFPDGEKRAVNVNAPEWTPTDFSQDNWKYKCKCKFGEINVFGSLEMIKQFGYDNLVIGLGPVTVQYTIRRSRSGFVKTLQEVADALKIKLEKLTYDKYKKWHTVNPWQVIV